MAFIIVKNAGATWQYYFMEDPKIGKVHESYSAHHTFTGMNLLIQPSYTEKEAADFDCDRMNVHNPSGDYAVCELM